MSRRRDYRSAFKPIAFQKATIIGGENLTDFRLLSHSTITLCLSALTGAEWATRWDTMDEEVLAIVRLASKELMLPVELPEGCDLTMSGYLEVGAILAYPTVLNPATGWLLCDGTGYTKEQYPELWEVLNDANVNWDGYHQVSENAFAVPDLREQKTITGADGSNPPGLYGGEKTHVLTVGELAEHAHTINSLRAIQSNAGSGTGWNIARVDSNPAHPNTDGAGGGTAHNNMPPWNNQFFHILAVPIEKDINLDDRYVRNVYEQNCELWQLKEGNEFITDLRKCSGKEWDDIEDGNQPEQIVDNDCLWGTVSDIVDFMIQKSSDFLDILEELSDAIDSVTDMLKNMGIQWVVPAIQVIEFVQFAGAIVISLARIDLADTELTDSWKCSLFCLIKANGGTLNEFLWDSWLDTLEDLNPPYAPGGFVMRLLEKYILGTNYLFKRYVLFANNGNCNDDWMLLCDCVEDITCDAVDITWISITSTPTNWQGEKKNDGEETWTEWTRANNENWRTTANWQTGKITYTPAIPCLLDHFSVYAARETSNSFSVDIKMLNPSGDVVAEDHWYYSYSTTPPPIFALSNPLNGIVETIEVTVWSKRARITRCVLSI